MKVALLSLAVLLGLFSSSHCADKFYNIKYNIDVDEILNSDRLLNNYFKCLVDKGRCTPDGAELKKIIPEALKNKCDKCSELQKDLAYKVIHHIAKNKPAMWDALEKKYDPQGVFKNLIMNDPAFKKYRKDVHL